MWCQTVTDMFEDCFAWFLWFLVAWVFVLWTPELEASPLPVPDREMRIMKQVAVEYGLTKEETRLLIAIRIHENGKPDRAFGIGHEVAGHPAKRYADAPLLSFLVQARWAAGTIVRRYDGDVLAFARRYCPRGPDAWFASVSRWMGRQQEKESGR